MLKRSIAQAIALGLVFLLTSLACAETITIGETAVLGNGDNGNRNLLLAQGATLTHAATLQSLSFYVTTASGQLRLGVYDASGPGGGPGLKKAETGAFTPGVGWNTRAVTTPVLLEAGTYWLAYAPSRNRLAFRKQLTGSARYYERTFGPMPTTFSTSPTVEAVHWSLYATLAPSAGSPAAPTVSLSANPSSVPPGGLSTLTWSSTNATSCTASNVGAEGSAWTGAKPTSGSDVRGPLTATATYSLSCTGPGGTASQSVTIAITASPPAAPTVTLTANPLTISAGQSTTLAWSSTNATSCTATGGWSGAQPLSGELVVATASTATYTLTCTGAGGSTAKSVTVTVIGGPAQLTLTWVDNAGGTATVKVERKTGTTGLYAQIATTTTGTTEYVDNTPVTGTTYCYRVRASNASGDSAYSNEACKAL